MRALATALMDRGTRTTLRAIGERVDGSVVVVDSYLRRADDPEFCRADVVAAVDDLGLDLEVDLAIEPVSALPAGSAAKARTRLVGLAYALVDPALRERPTASIDAVRTVLVTTGGSDAAGIGSSMAGALAAALPAVRIEAVAGPWGADEAQPGVHIVDGSAGIAGNLAAADLVVTAGGVTLLEALALGRPVIVIQTADNQRHYVNAVVRADAAIKADPAGIADAVSTLAADVARRRALSAAGRALIDGRGPDRVAEALLALT